ncbi:VWA domain-containing protein, partial [Hellea sp.]|nr:VWA domain-containing protein [Hellea sp.]
QQATHTGGTCEIVSDTRFLDGFLQDYDREVCTGQTTTYEEQFSVVQNRWYGCVGVRSDGLHMTDGPYTSTATRIQGVLDRQAKEETGLTYDVRAYCPRKITPLTDDYNELRDEIVRLYGTNKTYIPMGLNWGRRILSPEAPFTESDSVNPKRQVMVLMTDGNNTASLNTSPEAQAKYEAPPYIQEFTVEEQEAGRVAVQANADTATLCETIKNDGTELYTIAFRVTDPMTLSLLQNCASAGRYYFNAESNDELVETFASISDDLGGEIRIVR